MTSPEYQQAEVISASTGHTIVFRTHFVSKAGVGGGDVITSITVVEIKDDVVVLAVAMGHEGEGFEIPPTEEER